MHSCIWEYTCLWTFHKLLLWVVSLLERVQCLKTLSAGKPFVEKIFLGVLVLRSYRWSVQVSLWNVIGYIISFFLEKDLVLLDSIVSGVVLCLWWVIILFVCTKADLSLILFPLIRNFVYQLSHCTYSLKNPISNFTVYYTIVQRILFDNNLSLAKYNGLNSYQALLSSKYVGTACSEINGNASLLKFSF